MVSSSALLTPKVSSARDNRPNTADRGRRLSASKGRCSQSPGKGATQRRASTSRLAPFAPVELPTFNVLRRAMESVARIVYAKERAVTARLLIITL